MSTDRVDQMAPSEPPLLSEDHRNRIIVRCPWCEEEEPEEAFTELRTPPKYPEQCGVVLKHGGRQGCKGVFSIRALVRPARSVTA